MTVAVAALLLLNHLYFRSYHLLVLAFSLIGLLAALSIAACKAIHLCDIKPDKKYSKLVHTLMDRILHASTVERAKHAV